MNKVDKDEQAIKKESSTVEEVHNAQEKVENDAARKQLEACQHEVTTWKNKFLRASADFQNYKQRVEKERIQWISSGQAMLLTDLLTIVDDIDRALTEYKKQEWRTSRTDAWIDGFMLINKTLYKLLEKYGVKEITDITVFNPEIHEAVAHVASPDHTSGEIVAVMQKGFLFKDNVLRPAKVSVAQ